MVETSILPPYAEMMSRFYIPRRLLHEERPINQAELSRLGKVVLVLGEPGAGKSDLLADLGRTLGVQPRSASRFRYQNAVSGTALIIDALDEVVRLDPDAIDPIIVKASEASAPLVIFSSRSSEWDPARTRLVQECFGEKPTLVRLLPFDEAEQKSLFEAALPDEDFASFVAEADRFELRPLLGNPQFLYLFAEAYVQGGRRFASKRQIFVDAVTRLATEREDSPKQKGRAPINSIVEVAEEVFAKILLSGTSGVSLTDDPADQDFPYLNALTNRDRSLLKNTLDTRLFKLASEPGLHEPVHRIVAEYGAAQYLVRRIDDPGDLLALRRVLAVVAPNGAVRDELRGLLGWMAALGSQEMQTRCIETDPYAVLANGDPSQMVRQSKELLLRKLRDLSEVDPFFRRSDSWRRFSVAGFFDNSMVDLVRKELVGDEVVAELRDLLLELLQSSDAVSNLIPELRSLLLDSNCPRSTRVRVQRLLLELPKHDHRADFLALVKLGDRTSLRIAAETAPLYGSETLERADMLSLLRTSGQISGKVGRRDDQHVEHRYYVRVFIDGLELDHTIWLLDELTRDLSCSCGAKSDHRCTCLQSISRVIGQLLDRYFTLAAGPHDPARIWAWTKSLHFDGQATADSSVSVRTLKQDDLLRQAIHRVAFEGQASADDVWKMRMRFSMSHGHSGLFFKYSDYLAMVDHAFEANHVALWNGFYSRHNRYATEKGRDELRARMRSQARVQCDLLRIWCKNESKVRAVERKERATWGRSHRKYERREAEQKEETRDYFRENRDRIAAGSDWPALRWISNQYLIKPENLSEVFDDVAEAESLLRKSFEFLRPHVPSLAYLVDHSPYALRMLHAACLAHFRETGNLDVIDLDVLQAVRTDTGGYEGYREGEAEKFTAAIDRRIFPTTDEVEVFARTFIEPQLSRALDAATDAGKLRYDKAFEPVRDKLAFGWLERFPNMPWHTRETLFDICAKHTDRSALNALIEKHCADFVRSGAVSDEECKNRDFWFLRGLFFIDNPQEEIWDRFRSSRDSILMIEARAGRFGRGDSESWPNLSAEKIFRILDIYVGAWPKVVLPGTYGTGDPPEETVYRFLADVVWRIDQDVPDSSVPVFDRLLADARFADFHDAAKSQRASALRKRALKGFSPPAAAEIVDMLDRNRLVTVEDLRALIVEELERLETWVRNNETNPLTTYYANEKHVTENTARDRIVDRLQGRMSALNLSVVIERYMANENRCDITVSAMLGGRQRLLVIEVKGQWHKELYSAASAQLHERYSSHLDAAQQGVYLVLWFGTDVHIAGKREANITNPGALREAIIKQLPRELHHLIDVVIIDLSPRKTRSETSVSSDNERKKRRQARGESNP